MRFHHLFFRKFLRTVFFKFIKMNFSVFIIKTLNLPGFLC